MTFFLTRKHKIFVAARLSHLLTFSTCQNHAYAHLRQMQFFETCYDHLLWLADRGIANLRHIACHLKISPLRCTSACRRFVNCASMYSVSYRAPHNPHYRAWSMETDIQGDWCVLATDRDAAHTVCQLHCLTTPGTDVGTRGMPAESPCCTGAGRTRRCGIH